MMGPTLAAAQAAGRVPQVLRPRRAGHDEPAGRRYAGGRLTTVVAGWAKCEECFSLFLVCLREDNPPFRLASISRRSTDKQRRVICGEPCF